MLSPLFETRLDDLLAAWRHHNDLRRRRATIPQLAAARQQLDAARHNAYEVRRALNPEPSEVEDSLGTAYCGTVDETVFLFATEGSATENGWQLRCLCGELIGTTEGAAAEHSDR